MTCINPYFISTSKSLKPTKSSGKGKGMFSVLPRALAKLQKHGSVANAKLSLYY